MCKHEYDTYDDGITRVMDRYCGAYICIDCGDHEGLVRCYCGWAENGGNGWEQLVCRAENLGDDY